MSNSLCKDQAGDSEKEEFRQSESFRSLHHCTDPSSWCLSTAVSLFMFTFRDRPITSRQFLFLKQWVGGGADAQLPLPLTLSLSPLLLLCDWNRFNFSFFFLDSIIQEEMYLCVQMILTDVCLCCRRLSATVGEQDSEFSINFYFLFILFSYHLLYGCISAHLAHGVSRECYFFCPHISEKPQSSRILNLQTQKQHLQNTHSSTCNFCMCVCVFCSLDEGYRGNQRNYSCLTSGCGRSDISHDWVTAIANTPTRKQTYSTEVHTRNHKI